MKTIADSLSKDCLIGINKRFRATLRDEGTLDYIVYKTSKTRGINRKAATLLIEIVTQHPFYDANKRTAIEAMEMFLESHNREIVVRDSTLFDLVFRITSKRYSINDISNWIANHTKYIK